MKKKLLKFSLLAFTVFFTTTALKAQTEEFTGNGIYKVKIPNEDLFITINVATGALEWAAELPGEDPTQVFTFQTHSDPFGASEQFRQITADVPGEGMFTWATNAVEADGRNVTIIARPGAPVVAPAIDLSGQDQFQMRKTPTNMGGNDALFIKLPWDGGSRFGAVPAAAGEAVKFDGGGIDKLEFNFVSVLSSSNFDSSSIFVSNPVSNQITIKGLTNTVSQLEVYSLLGKRVISADVDGRTEVSLNVNALTNGMYIVKMIGDNVSFSKKIVKQ